MPEQPGPGWPADVRRYETAASGRYPHILLDDAAVACFLFQQCGHVWSYRWQSAGGEAGARHVGGLRPVVDMVTDRTRTRHRLSKFLLRHDRIWRGGDAWTLKHEQWLLGQRFDDAALRATYAHYRAMLVARDAELAAVQADLAHWYTHGPFTDAVARLAAYRGVAQLGALSICQRGR